MIERRCESCMEQVRTRITTTGSTILLVCPHCDRILERHPMRAERPLGISPLTCEGLIELVETDEGEA